MAFLKDYVCQALWAKLKVGEQLPNLTKFPWCPMCAQIELVHHTMHECQFAVLSRDSVDFCCGPSYVVAAVLSGHFPCNTPSLPSKGSHCGLHGLHIVHYRTK